MPMPTRSARRSKTVLKALKRLRCRIPLGEPNESGSNWASVPLLPEPLPAAEDKKPAPRTEVRALAGKEALYVCFDCALDDPQRLTARNNWNQPVTEGEAVYVVLRASGSVEANVAFFADYKGMRESRLDRWMPMEKNQGTIPDAWKERTAGPDDWRVYHGFNAHKWWVEMVLPWSCIGLARRPSTLGFNYGRNLGPIPAEKSRRYFRWGGDGGKTASDLPAILESSEACIGSNAGYPEALELEPPRFGTNGARLLLGENWPKRPGLLCVSTLAPAGDEAHSCEIKIRPGAGIVPFQYFLDRQYCSHLDIFSIQRLKIELKSADGILLYSTTFPMDRHLGVTVDEPYGEKASPRSGRSLNTRAGGKNRPRDLWLDRVIRRLPRLHRACTTTGAPSDFCLMFEDGKLAVNLMADDAWKRLAAIVEKRFASGEERLVGAMALIGQKSVTNLTICDKFFNIKGEPAHNRMLHEWMGPLSILRYGGGPAVCRAVALGRLLHEIKDPATGKPFITRVLSLTREGGPRQVTRGYNNLSPFWQYPGRIGAVAVDYMGSQTLLDPTLLAFFPKEDGRLATLEEIAASEELRRTGAGRLAEIYGKIDLDEVRRQQSDRLLTRGVFPEMAPDEDGPDHPFDQRLRRAPRCLITKKTGMSKDLEGFRNMWNHRGMRDGSVSVGRTASGLVVRVKVRGVDYQALRGRDLEMERVHLFIDATPACGSFRHFMVTAAGERQLWSENFSAIQTLFKHLSTDGWSQSAEHGTADWTARLEARPGGYEVLFEITRTALGISRLPAVMGFNVWIDCRYPCYGQVYLAPPRSRAIADPFSFADLYLTDTPVTVAEIDYGIPRYEENEGRIVARNSSPRRQTVTIETECRLQMRRSVIRSGAITVAVPPRGRVTARFPYFVSEEEKIDLGGSTEVTLRAKCGTKEICVFKTRFAYATMPGTFQRYGKAVGRVQNPKPGDPDFLRKKTRFICSRIPDFQRFTTRDGAASDFLLRAKDRSVKFNLMEPGVLDKMARWVEATFDNDVDRLLGMFYLCYHPNVGRHLSGGHRIAADFGGLSIMRAYFAGGGGNCGFHSHLFAVMASHLTINGKRLAAHTLPVWGHCISGFAWRGSKAIIDADVGHIFLTPDGSDIATIEEFRINPSVMTTAGPGDLGRYYTVDNNTVLYNRTGVRDDSNPGIFPVGAPIA